VLGFAFVKETNLYVIKLQGMTTICFFGPDELKLLRIEYHSE